MHILEEEKNIKKILISYFIFWRLFFEVKERKVFENVQHQKNHFRVPVIFESENFAAHAIFGIGLTKIYLIGRIVPVLENRKKFLFHPNAQR